MSTEDDAPPPAAESKTAAAAARPPDTEHAAAPPPGAEHAPAPAGTESAAETSRDRLRWLHRAEEAVPVLALLVMVLLPLGEIVARQMGTGIPGAAPFTQHLTLWVAMLGAAIAARQGKLLALATEAFIPVGAWREAAAALAGAVGAAVSIMLARASLDMVLVEREAGTLVDLGVRAWVAQLALPIGFALIALRLVWK